MRSIITLFVLTLALPAAADGGREACAALQAEAARVVAEPASCRAGADGLTLVLSPSAFETLKAAAFPAGAFRGFAVQRLPEPLPVTPRQAVELRDAVASPRSAKAERLIVNASFDGAASRAGFTPVAGPPGSTPNDKEKDGVQAPRSTTRPGSAPQSGKSQAAPPRQGPPGSNPNAGQPRSGPPGSTPNNPSRPPSSRPPGGNDSPPSASQPPSKPTKIYIPPAPPPHWSNTVDWGRIPAWSSLPNEWDQNRLIEHDPRRMTYVTRWFTYGAEAPRYAGIRGDEKATRRRAGQDSLGFRLTQTEVIEITQRYYRGVFDLRWNSFEGEWDARFREHEAATRVWVVDGPSRRHDVDVDFDMRGKSLMPWESEVVRVTLSPHGITSRVEQPSYEYAQAPGGPRGRITYVAGDKLATAPDHDGVTAELVPDHAAKTLTLRIHDKWAGYYQGETLEVDAKIMYVTSGWFTRNEVIDEFDFDAGSQLRIPSAAPANAPGAGQTVDKSLSSKGCGTYYIESWSFRRGNNAQPDNKSLISRPDVVRKGGSARIKVCR